MVISQSAATIGDATLLAHPSATRPMALPLTCIGAADAWDSSRLRRLRGVSGHHYYGVLWKCVVPGARMALLQQEI